MTRIGVLGFGEAGSSFALALAEGGAAVSAYDTAWAEPGAPAVPGVTACASPAELVAASDALLSTVTTDAALEAAEACLPHLGEGQVYCDLNSTAPSVKRRLDALVAPTAARFVEGAILGAIGVSGARSRILLGGTGAEAVSATLNAYGLNTSAYSREIGKASAFKLLRSVFSKGLEALLVEFLLAGRAAGLEDELWREVTGLMAEHGFEEAAGNWVRSHAVAHERRAHEMVEVTALLRELAVDPIMTEATTRLFERSTALGLGRDFAGKPERMDAVIEALLGRLSERPG